MAKAAGQPKSPFLRLPRQRPTLQRRNVCGHFSPEEALGWDRKLAQAYDEPDYGSAKRALERILRELIEINPSAARSLEEGLEETLTLQRLKVPRELWKSLRSTNLIESAFSVVRVLCRNVKRWRPRSADSEGWRSAFRTDVDHDSEVMPISVPN